MNIKDLLHKYLLTQNYEVEVTSFGLQFKDNNFTYVFITESDDDNFFQISLQHIYDVDENNYPLVVEAADRNTAKIKVVKTYILESRVDLSFEILIDNDPCLGDIVPRAINLIGQARTAFYKEVEALE